MQLVPDDEKPDDPVSTGSADRSTPAAIRFHVWLRPFTSNAKWKEFGLHVWGPAVKGTAWEDPLAPLGADWFGPYFDVSLEPVVLESGAALGLLLHRGDEKAFQTELAAGAVPADGSEVWVGPLHPITPQEPDANSMPAGDLGEGGARAHWLNREYLAWRSAAFIAGHRVLLYHSQQALLEDAGGQGVQGSDGAVDLEVVDGGLTTDLAAAHPYLQGCGLLRLPSDLDVEALCREQLAVGMQTVEGVMVDCTGVQLAPLLDEMYAYDGPLGCCPRSDNVALVLWAPTALQVDAVLYTDARSDSAEVCQMQRSGSGTWSTSLAGSCLGKYYTYRIRAYHPVVRKVVTMEAPDPYSQACSADATRTLICELEARHEVRAPAIPGGQASSVIYELHVRDFSASDQSVPEEMRGKYGAFGVEGTTGDQHLRRFAEAGVTHVQLLPTFDFASVPERQQDRREPELPADAAPDSEAQQAAIGQTKDVDAFNWGYDPVLYNVPEGSYAMEPDGHARVLEYQQMVANIHKKGLRVVVDVVYNHTSASGPAGRYSVLDKCVPGYYHRRSERGDYENSTCMNNTAAERSMMARLVVDSVLHWVKIYGVDGFRFDLMGHLPLACLKKVRSALDALTIEEHSVKGADVLLYGEGWEFGEIANGQRGTMSVQQKLAGTGIGSFNDRIRDAAIGGSPFADPRLQGFATGLALRPWPEDSGFDQGPVEKQSEELSLAADRIRLSLVGLMRDYELAKDSGGEEKVKGGQLQGAGIGYTAAPVEAINYVCAHDNETLYDCTVWKMHPTLFSPEERMRANWLCTSLVLLGHGVPFIHAGEELLRSKSLDRDSYNSGDWFNVLDFTGERSAFGTGLPPKDKNGDKWDLMRPLLTDPTLRPTKEMALATAAKVEELLRIRRSTPLIGLVEAADVLEKVEFPTSSGQQMPGVIAMQTCNGPTTTTSSSGSSLLCGQYARVIVVFSARFEQVRFPLPPPPQASTKNPLQLHPLQQTSEDPVTRSAFYDAEAEVLVVPPQTASVFVEPLQEVQQGDPSP